MSLNLSLEPAKRRGIYYCVAARVSAVWRFKSDKRFAVRGVAVLVIAAMLMPAIYLGGVRQASARSLAPIRESAPISAPPEPFVVPGSESGVRGLLAFGRSSWQFLNDFVSPAQSSKFQVQRSDLRVPADSPTLAETIASGAASVFALFIPSLKKENRNSEDSPVSTLNPPPIMPPPPAPPPAGSVRFDFDGDGKADIGNWHGLNSEFKVRNSYSGSYSTYTIGSSNGKPAPGDYDGDGKTDAAVFNGMSWNIRYSSDGSSHTASWGQAGDLPVAGDYDGDGKTDTAVWRPSTANWCIVKSSNQSTLYYQFGQTGDLPVTGNFDGDSKTDYALFRQSTGDWYLQQSASGYSTFHWGMAGDIPVVGDYDGDGKTDPAVFRGSSGIWYILKSSTNYSSYTTVSWGTVGDQPTPADYDGDGKTDVSVWRATTSVWYTIKSSDSSYDYQTLGVAGDIAIPSAYLKQIGGRVTGYDGAQLRLSAKNATGGTNLYSQNFSWGTSLVGLPGRAGLDAGFGMSYNSLVWIKDAPNSTVYFDPDYSNIGPGFRFGFPVIEPIYYDSSKLLFAYLMVTPDGGRTEFRQTAASNTYEAADSSYAQLVTSGASNPNDPVENITIKVTATDGTQAAYEWKGGAFRCKEVKDRNGNYITVTNNNDGLMTKVTDTLGREINVSYDTGNYPISITQTWKTGNGDGANTPHNWATFAYTTQTVSTGFSGLTVAGPPNGTALKVLDKVTYADGSYTKFYYNGYLQVQKIENYAADNHKLNHVRTNLDSISGAQGDCPRFTETRTMAENFNVSGGTPQEVVVTNSIPAGSSFSGPNGSESTMVVKVTMASHPDNLYARIHFGPSGYKEGLTLATEDCTGTDSACATRKRWTWTDYTQDSTGASYITNPRVVESRVGDGTNTKKTTISYRFDSVSGTHREVTEKQAMDFEWATGYVSDLLNNAIGMVTNYEAADRKSLKNPGLTYTSDQRAAMMFRIYNAGGVSSSMRNTLAKTDNPSVLDPGTANNNYASNLVNLHAHCIAGAQVKGRGF